MTPGVFNGQMERLQSLRFPKSDIAEYWDALREIPDELFTAAVSHAIRTRVDFPVPSELRADTDAVARRMASPQAVHPTSRMVPVEGGTVHTIKNPFGGPDLTVTVSEELRRDCDDCDDSGNVLYWCGEEASKRWPWLYRRQCERRNSHADHDWAAPCPCVGTNPTIQRRIANQKATYAQEPEKVNRR